VSRVLAQELLEVLGGSRIHGPAPRSGEVTLAAELVAALSHRSLPLHESVAATAIQLCVATRPLRGARRLAPREARARRYSSLPRRTAVVGVLTALAALISPVVWYASRSPLSSEGPHSAVSTGSWSPAAQGQGAPNQAVASGIPTVRIFSPVDGSTVRQCEVLAGIAIDLAPSTTLVLGVRNLSNGDVIRYFEPVDYWQDPSPLWHWSGHQRFGSVSGSVGQQFRVEVLMVDLSVARSHGRGVSRWADSVNPSGSTVVAELNLWRVAGAGSAECS
jgi:hypothetical protein